MCSSDSRSDSQGAWRFARGLTLGLVIAIAAAVIPSILVDPTAQLAQRWPGKPQVCTPGIQANLRRAKFYLEEVVRPREVLLGTSRIMFGFASTDVTSRLASPALNMGITGAAVVEIAATLQRSIAGGRLQRAWIGLDYGMFARAPRMPVTTPQHGALRLVDAVLHSDSIRSAYGTLLDPGRCTAPPVDGRGFPLEAYWRARIDAKGWNALVQRSKTGIESDFQSMSARKSELTESLVSAQWAALHRAIASARLADIEVVLFVNPSHRYYREAVAHAGLDRSLLEWRHQLARYAEQEKLPLFDWSDYPITLQTNLEACNPMHDARCPLYDVDHYRPQIGRALLDSMLQQLNQPKMAHVR